MPQQTINIIFLHQELRKQLEDEQLQADITHAIDVIQNVLDGANEAIHKEHLAAAVVDLSERVDDWKTLKMDSFGDLLRFGTFAVVKGDSGKDSEREVCVSNFRISGRSYLADVAYSITSSCLSASFYAAKISIRISRRPN